MTLIKLLNLLSGMMLMAACSYQGRSPVEMAIPPVPEALSSTLSHPRVTAIAEDSFGHIWVGTAHGLNKDLGYGYRQYFAGEDSLSLHDNHIASLYCDSKKRLWVLALDGSVYQYTPEETFYTIPMDFHGISHPQIIELPQGTILCNTERQIFRFNEPDRRMEQIIHNTEANTGCFVTTSGRLVVVYPKKIRYYDGSSFTLLKEIPLPMEFKNARMSPDGTLWLSGFGGLLNMDTATGEFMNVPESLKNEISKGRLLDIVSLHDETLLFNTRSALVQYDSRQGNRIVSADPASPYYTADYDINCLFMDTGGNLWLGLNGGGVRRIGYGKTHAGLHPLLEYFRNKSISALAYADGGLDITAGKGQRYHFDMATGTIQTLPFSGISIPSVAKPGRGKDIQLTLSDGWTLSADYDNDLVFAHQNETVTIPLRFLTAAAESQHFVPEVLFEDSEKTIWIGTQSDGVLRIAEDRKDIRKIQRISCEEISSILEDKSGHIWIGTQYGLNEYTRSGDFLATYTTGNGVSSNAFTEGAACCLPDGVLLFGTMQGIVARFSSEEASHKAVPLLLEDLKVQNRLIRPGDKAPIRISLNYAPPITLSHRENSFSISYAALDYSNAAGMNYQYKLEGLDSYWVDAGNSHEAFYSNVPAGKYTFSVRITNAKGIPVSETVSTSLRIRPAPWASWWARTLYLFLVCTLISGIAFTWLRHLKKQEETRKAKLEKEQEQKTNEINKRYFANVAHQLRTPLTMISGPVGTLSESDAIKGSNKTLLRIVRHNTDRMLHLVNQIMDFNALETDALALKVRRVDICPILRNTLDIYQINAEEKGIHFLSDGLDENTFIYADADKVVNILDNLLSNAIKYAPAGGFISVSFSDIDGNAVLKVSNSGPAIPENQLERIFERYYQIDGATLYGRYNWGSGVGLYYARKLAELHHGTLSCTNAEDGSGVCFTLSFPSSQEHYKPEETDQGPAPQTIGHDRMVTETVPVPECEPAGARPYVLVVDDDSDITFYLRTLLSPSYQISCCYDVESAEKQLTQRIPDIILSDIMMNGRTGYDFCNFLKGDLQYCHIPVILLTAKDSVRDQIDGMKAGADAYVTKPFNAEYLLSLVDNLLKGRERLRKALTDNAGLDISSDDVLSPQDKSFLNDLYTLMEAELSNSEFNIGDIVDKLHISHSKFLYKVKGLTGTTPSELFKNYKLNKAAAMLREGKYNVSEVADLTGFSSLAHFSKVFKKKFGVSPSEYQ